MEALVAHGAEVEAPRFSALACLATVPERGSKARALIARGASPNAMFSGSTDPLLVVYARGEYEDVLEVLLDSGAEVDARGQHARTALMEAAVSGQPRNVALLLKRGADRSARDEAGDTAQTLAEQQIKREFARAQTFRSVLEALEVVLPRAG